jgi:hypothetical protein
MKKLLLFITLAFTLGMAAHAQNKDKLKKTSTIPQKVHNTVSKHKKHKGYKTKHKHNSVTSKHKVNTQEGEIKIKTNK